MATIKDVAKMAGVSISTVSKAYNNYSEVSDTTKQRIAQVAKTLGYIPNKTAVELSQGQRKYVGLIVKNSIQDEFLRMISGVHSTTETYGYELVIYTTQHIKSKNMSYVDFCRYHSLVGAIVSGLDKDDPYLHELTESETPCVLVDIELHGKNTAYVSTDNLSASYQVFELLYAHGHRHICHVTGSMSAEVAHKRKDGFVSAAKDNNLPLNQLTFVDGDWSETTAYQATQTVLHAHPEITAVYAASDTMALGAMTAIRQAGYTIGQDFSLIGFDGISILRYTSPPLATVAQGLVGIGEVACQTLFKICRGEAFEPQNYVDFEIVPRQSIHQIHP